MHAGAALHIDPAAIAENTRLIASRTTAEVMAVVKADAFGHGTAVLTALDHGATRLGVTSIDEALPLRWRGIAAPILSWLNPVDADFETAILNRIDIAVPSIDHLHAIARAASTTGRAAHVHLHLDTGLARDGIDSTEWATLCELARIAEHADLIEVHGIMSHLARADVPGDAATRRQVMLFRNAVRSARHRGLAPRLLSLAATAGTLSDPATHFGMVRIGAGLYGIDPSHTTVLRGAMSLTAPIATVRDVAAGTGVGYGLGFHTDRRTRLGLVPIGYADGIPRSLSPAASVLVRDRRVPIVGAVSMDQLVVDLGDLGVAAGETVAVFGPGDAGEPTIADWAGWAGTIEQDIVTRIGPRIGRQVAAAA